MHITTLNIRVPVKVAVTFSAGLFRCSHVRQGLVKHKQPLVIYYDKTNSDERKQLPKPLVHEIHPLYERSDLAMETVALLIGHCVRCL
jgi:hypothetical protein